MTSIASFAIGAGLLLAGFNQCVYLVHPGERALIMNKIYGLQPTVFGPGYHIRIPFIQVHLTSF